MKRMQLLIGLVIVGLTVTCFAETRYRVNYDVDGTPHGSMIVVRNETNVQKLGPVVKTRFNMAYDTGGGSLADIVGLCYEDLDGKLIQLSYYVSYQNDITSYSVIMGKQSMKVTKKTKDGTTEDAFEVYKPVYMNFGRRSALAQREMQPRPNTSMNMETFNLYNTALNNVSYYYLADEEIALAGDRKIKCRKLLVQRGARKKLGTLEWIDKDGNLVKSEKQTVEGVRTGILAESSEFRETVSTSDWISKGLVPISGDYATTGSIREISMRLDLGMGWFPEDDKLNMAKLVPRARTEVDGRLTMTNYRTVPKAHIWTLPLENLPEDIKKYLADSPMAPVNNAEIKRVADEWIPEDTRTDGRRIAFMLTRAIHKHTKSLPVHIDSSPAPQILSRREGDSIELALAYVAIARSLGVPSRLAIGLAYAPEKNAFVCQGWPEFHLGGWFAVDPVNNDFPAMPNRIPFVYPELTADGIKQALADITEQASSAIIVIEAVN